MIGISIQCRALLLSGVLAVLLAGQVSTVEAQQCGSVSINVTRYGPLVLECKGNIVKWRNYHNLGIPNIFHTKPNAERVQTSWLVIENVTTSASSVSIKCSGRQCSTWYNIKVFAPPSNVNITDSGLTANTVRLDDTTTLTCSAAGTDPLQYMWYCKASYRYYRTPVPGANSTNYTVYSAKSSDVGEYTCEVSNWAGKSSETYTLHVQSPPSDVRITDSGLTSNTVKLGTTTTLGCSASGTGPFVYQWRHNSTIIPAATSSTYRVTFAEFSDAGRYTCQVSNLVGNDWGSYTLNVQAHPSPVTITDSGLNSATIRLGASTRLSCSSRATSPQYQWSHNGSNISNAISSWYTISSANYNDAGRYTCLVSNLVGTDYGSYQLQVQAPPSDVRITDSGLTSNTVQLGTSTTLRCSASGPAPFVYQWSHNGIIPAATSSTYRISSVEFSDAGRYTCQVSNLVGNDRGSYTLNVQAHPSPVTITDSGLNSRTIRLGASTRLSCSSPATSPQYQWSHNGSNISSAISSWYTVSSANFNDAGTYTCLVSNLVGTDYGSYKLQVQAQPTIEGMNTSSSNNKIILRRGVSSSVTMFCTANQDAGSVTFEWRLNRGTVPGSTDQSIINHVVGRLFISSVTLAHGGTYRCSTRNLVGNDHQELNFTVVDPPRVEAIRVNGSIVSTIFALKGTTSRFSCVAGGTSPLTTSWELQTMRGKTNRVGSTFSSILTQEDEGRYTCVVVNGQEGLSDNASVTVKVYDPITLTSDAMTELEHNENDQVTLRCLFFKDQDDPDPFPQVAWNGPGVDITRNAFQTVSNIYVSTFTFTATRWYHGQFSCSVNDDGVGTISATFQLTVYYPPTDVALRSTPASVNNGSSTTINCTGHSRPPPEFSINRWLANGKKSTSSGGTFLLQPTSREELGDNLLTCSATNSKYSTPVFSATRTILVKGAPDAVDSNSIHMTSRSFTSVSVQWTTPQNNYDAIRYYQFQLGECATSDQTGSECQPVYTQYRSRSTSLSYTLKRLKPFKTYTLKIVAYNNVGPGPFSNAVAFQTVQQDEATVRNFTASLQGDTAVLFQWYADVNLTQDGTAFSYFRLTLLRQGFPEVVNANLSLGDAQCSNSSMTEFCHEWEGFAAGVSYSVWIEMMYSYPATGGRVDLTVTIPSASASAPLVAAMAGGAGGGLLTAVLALVALVIIPVIVVVLHCRRKSRVKKPEKNPEGEEDETNCSSTARSSDYRYEANIAAKSNVSTEIEESATQLDQARATITPTVNTINPYQPLDVEGVADCNAYTSYNFGQPANPKGDEPEYAMVDIAGGACRKDDCKISSSRGGGVRNQNSDSHLDPDYAVPSEAMSEYAADENIYMEPDIDIVQDTTKMEDVCESTKSAATTGAHPPNSGKKKKALLPMANKKQTSPSTSPKPKQPTAAGTNAATSMTADLQQGPPQVSEAPAPTSTSPRPQCPEHPVASVTSPLQQNAPQVSEAPAQRTLPKPQYPKQKPAADTNAAAKMTPASSLQRCDSKASERQSTKPQPKPKGQGMDPPAPDLRRSVSPASSLHRCDSKASERQSTKPQPKPKGQNMDPPTPGLRRSVSAAKPPQREVPVQQGVGPPSSVADRRCMQPSHGGDTKVDSTVKLRDSSAGPTPPQVAPKGTPAKPKCKPRPTAAQASQVTASPVEASPVRSEGIRKTPPTPAVRQAHLPPATPAGQLQTTGNPQSGPTAGKMSVAERAKLLEKMM